MDVLDVHYQRLDVHYLICKPEYKVPGLYVIDSIVRQSRHQFGQEKDVFAPRFSNNIISTFQNLYRCPGDDKSKIVRVLNLWQKNNVFKSEIIQPLLDMAAGIPPPVVTPVLASTTAAMSNTPGTPVTPVTPANVVQGLPDPWVSQITNTDTLAAVAQILQSPQGQQLQQLIQTLQIQQQKPQPSILQALDAGLVVQLQALTAQLTAAAAAANTLNPLEQGVSFNKMIPPRGCAYVCMVHRQDAFRALQKLSSGSYKIGSKVIKIAWALNKGVKTEYKQFWDVDLGVTYIPWEKVKVDDLEGFAEGGMIDQETVNTGFMPPPVPPPVVPPPTIPPVVPTSLVQPPLAMTPEAVKDVGFGGLVLPGGAVASGLATSTLPAGSVFNPPTKQAEPEEKVPHLLDHQISSGENTRSEKPWGPRDFDEREHRVLPVYGGPKGLHEERGRFRSGNYRFDPRSGPWNRGFGQEVHRDFDDRRRPWERQRDRDDRDFDFCREINGNRLGRDRIQNTWVPPPHARVFEFFEGATSQRKAQSDPELYEKLTSSSEINKEKSDTVADIESEPVVESTETEGT
ncbi:hypothetical protein CB1_000719005 [Camelus ferus]|nr:hypothetical protein CB1_000719005 [Camelus ferus]